VFDKLRFVVKADQRTLTTKDSSPNAKISRIILDKSVNMINCNFTVSFDFAELLVPLQDHICTCCYYNYVQHKLSWLSVPKNIIKSTKLQPKHKKNEKQIPNFQIFFVPTHNFEKLIKSYLKQKKMFRARNLLKSHIKNFLNFIRKPYNTLFNIVK